MHVARYGPTGFVVEPRPGWFGPRVEPVTQRVRASFYFLMQNDNIFNSDWVMQFNY